MIIVALALLLHAAAPVKAQERSILEVDPYSIDSLRKYFPKAVETEIVPVTGPQDFKKRIGPRLKETVQINYSVLIPEMLELLKEQNQEIQRLKSFKTR